MTGVPTASDSMTTLGIPSYHSDGHRIALACFMRNTTSSLVFMPSQRTLLVVAAAFCTSSRNGPSPAIQSGGRPGRILPAIDQNAHALLFSKAAGVKKVFAVSRTRLGVRLNEIRLDRDLFFGQAALDQLLPRELGQRDEPVHRVCHVPMAQCASMPAVAAALPMRCRDNTCARSRESEMWFQCSPRTPARRETVSRRRTAGGNCGWCAPPEYRRPCTA